MILVELITVFDRLLTSTNTKDYISLKQLKSYFWQAYSKHKGDYSKIFNICSKVLSKTEYLNVFYYMKNQHPHLKIEFKYKDKKYSILIVDGKIKDQNNILDNYLLQRINKICEVFSGFYQNGIYDYIIDINSEFTVNTNLGEFILSAKKDIEYSYDYVYLEFKSAESQSLIFSEFYNPNIIFTKYAFRDFLFNMLRNSQIKEWSAEFEWYRKTILNTDFDNLIKIEVSSLPQKIQDEIKGNDRPKLKDKIAIENTLEQLIKEALKNGENSCHIHNVISREDICTLIENPIPHYELKPLFRYNKILRMLNLSLCSFEQVCIEGIDFSGTNAAINPQTVYLKSLKNTNCDGITFITLDFSDCILDNCKITFPNYVNLDNVSSYTDAEIEYAIINGEFITKEKAYPFKMK